MIGYQCGLFYSVWDGIKQSYPIFQSKMSNAPTIMMEYSIVINLIKIGGYYWHTLNFFFNTLTLTWCQAQSMCTFTGPKHRAPSIFAHTRCLGAKPMSFFYLTMAQSLNTEYVHI